MQEEYEGTHTGSESPLTDVSSTCSDPDGLIRNSSSTPPPPTLLSQNSSTEDLTESIKAVATAAALVGETIIESPNSKKTMTRMESPSAKRGINRFSFSNAQMKEILAKHEEQESGTIGRYMDMGVKWWTDRKERKQREQLEKQVEEQRRKLYEAEVLENQGMTLAENATFQQMTSQLGVAVGLTSAPSAASDEEKIKVFSPHMSKSGAGMTVELAVGSQEEDDDWIPNVRIAPEPPSAHKFCAYICTDEQFQRIAQHVLPPTMSHCPWKRVYSLARDGDAFDAFLRLVHKEQHTLLVVRTTANAVFGAYADSPWEAEHQGNPQFYGSAQACLFRIEPNGKQVTPFKWSGANRYIQFVDVSNKMLAFGGGGADGAFGLCLERDFQQGSTGRCDTFANDPLCDQENFEVVDVECYGFLTGQF